MTEPFEATMGWAASRLLGYSMEAAFNAHPPMQDSAEWLCIALVAAMTAQQRHPEWGLFVTRQYEAAVRADYDALADRFAEMLPVSAVY